MRNSYPDALRSFGVVLIFVLVGLPLASFGLHWGLIHLNDYSAIDLRIAKAYVDSLPASAAPYRFSGNSALTGIAGTPTSVRPIRDALAETRRGYYNANLSGDGQIEIVIAPGLLSADPAHRLEAVDGLVIAPGTRTTVLAATPTPSGCALLAGIQFGWIERAYILVDTETVEDATTCATVGFDVFSGFPVKDATFDYRKMPDSDVRRLVMDFMDDCAQRHKSDVDPKSKNGHGVSRPSLACVSSMISDVQKLNVDKDQT